jgi:hypothetical protein
LSWDKSFVHHLTLHQTALGYSILPHVPWLLLGRFDSDAQPPAAARIAAADPANRCGYAAGMALARQDLRDRMRRLDVLARLLSIDEERFRTCDCTLDVQLRATDRDGVASWFA